MYSNRRADGVLLEAMIKADPKNDLIPKLVRGLLDHRVKGAWSNTQENVFILLALDKYFNTFEKVTPDFVTRIWLGNTYAGEEVFKGRSVDSKQLNIPMSYLTDQGGTSNLILDRQGAGRLYYRIGMKYAPKNLKLDPADYGFTVLRKYEAVDDKDDVKQNADGSWTIKAGARVRVRLTMVAQARRYHVALVDNLPAGLEILNPELATTEAIPADHGPEYLGPRIRQPIVRLRLVVVAAILVRAPEFPRRACRGIYVAAVGRRLQLFVRHACHDARPIRRPARQGRGDVSPRDVWPDGNGFCN